MTPASLEGQTLGKYRILEPLGRGGMAQVYRAYHPQLDRYVAVKVLRSDLVENEEFLARFRREAQSVAALRHPHIVQVFDFDVQDDLYYMVMELLEGNTLKAYLNDYRGRGERLPWAEAVRILLDVLAGLEYAHSEGITHRDIKPANIMLTRRGQAVVTDFGIAHIVGGTQYTVSGALIGTLNYMAPEQGLKGHGDSRSDIYSLGIVFYEMLTGRTPFDADTPLAILMKHLNDPLPLPNKFDPTIPEPLERVLLKALSKQPEDRFQSASEMAQALSDAAQQAGIELPERVDLPQPVSTTDNASDSVKVYSGSARQQIVDQQFAGEETDATLGERLAAQQSAPPSAPPHTLVNRLLGFAGSDQQKISVLQAVGLGVGLLVGANLLLVMFAGPTGQIGVFDYAWPIEIFLSGLFLCLLMAALERIWLLIPAGIILGNGIIMTYYSLTGWWSHWEYLWPLEPILVGVLVYYTLATVRGRRASPETIRRLGYRLARAAAVTALFVLMMSFMVLWLHRLLFGG
ncbi:MAG: protein kinase [Chloroflexota bacterium]